MIPSICFWFSPGLNTTNAPMLFWAICIKFYSKQWVYFFNATLLDKLLLQKHTFFIASTTGSSDRHHSQEPVRSRPFVMSTSATVTFSNPFRGNDEEAVIPPKREKSFSIFAVTPPWECCKILAFTISWQDRTARPICCIFIVFCLTKHQNCKTFANNIYLFSFILSKIYIYSPWKGVFLHS